MANILRAVIDSEGGEELTSSLERVATAAEDAAESLEDVDEKLGEISSKAEATQMSLSTANSELQEMAGSADVGAEQLEEVGDQMSGAVARGESLDLILEGVEDAMAQVGVAARAVGIALESVSDGAEDAGESLSALSGINVTEAGTAATAKQTNEGLAESLDDVEQQAEDATEAMAGTIAMSELLSMESSALSINVGMFTVALRNLTTQVPLLTAVLGNAAAAFVGLQGAIIGAAGAMGALALGGFLATAKQMSGSLNNTKQTMAAMKAIMQEFRRMLIEAIQPLLRIQGIVEMFKGLLEGIATTINAFAAAIADMMEKTGGQVGVLRRMINTISSAWMNNLDTIVQGFKTLIKTIGPEIAGLVAWMIRNFDEFMRFVANVTQGIINLFDEIGQPIINFASQLIHFGQAIAAGIVPILSTFFQIVTDVVSVIRSLGKGAISAAVKMAVLLIAVNQVAGIIGTLLGPIAALSGAIIGLAASASGATDAFLGMIEGFTKGTSRMEGGMGRLVSTMGTLIGRSDEAGSNIHRLRSSIAEAGGAFSLLRTRVSSLIPAFASSEVAAASLDEELEETADTNLAELKTSIVTTIPLLNRVEESAEDAQSRLSQLGGVSIGGIFGSLSDGISGALGSIRESWNSLIEWMVWRVLNFSAVWGNVIKYVEDQGSTLRTVGALFIDSMERAIDKSLNFAMVTSQAFDRVRERATEAGDTIRGRFSRAIGAASSFSLPETGLSSFSTKISRTGDNLRELASSGFGRATAAARRFGDSLQTIGGTMLSPFQALRGELVKVRDAFASSEGRLRSFKNAALTGLGDIQIRDRARRDIDTSLFRGGEKFGDLSAGNVAQAFREKWLDPIGRVAERTGERVRSAVNVLRGGIFRGFISAARGLNTHLQRLATGIDRLKVQSGDLSSRFGVLSAATTRATDGVQDIREALSNLTVGYKMTDESAETFQDTLLEAAQSSQMTESQVEDLQEELYEMSAAGEIAGKSLNELQSEMQQTAVFSELTEGQLEDIRGDMSKVSLQAYLTSAAMSALGSTTLALGAIFGALAGALAVIAVVGGTVALILAKIGQSGKSAKEMMKTFKEIALDIGATILPFFVQSAEMMLEIFRSIAAVGGALMGALREIGVALGIVSKSAEDGAGGVQGFINTLGSVISVLSGVVNFVGYLARVIAGNLVAGIRQATDMFVGFLNAINASAILGSFISELRTLLKNLGGLKGIVNAVIGVLSVFAGIMSKVVGVIVTVGTAGLFAFMLIADFILKVINTVFWLIDVIGKAISTFMDMTGLSAVFSLIADSIGVLIDGFGMLLSAIAPVLSVLGGAFMKIGKMVIGILTLIGRIVMDVIVGAFVWLGKTIMWALNKLVGFAMGFDFIRKAAGVLIDAMSKLGEFVGWLIDMFFKLPQAINWVFNKVLGIIEGAVNFFVDAINKLITGYNAIPGLDNIESKLDRVELTNKGKNIDKQVKKARKSAKAARPDEANLSGDVMAKGAKKGKKMWEKATPGGAPANFNYKEGKTVNNFNQNISANPKDKSQISRIAKDAMKEANSFARRQQGGQ